MIWMLGDNLEITLDWHQWMIGWNYHTDYGFNLFFLCLRFGYNPRGVYWKIHR